jgi:hypothetical protein
MDSGMFHPRLSIIYDAVVIAGLPLSAARVFAVVTTDRLVTWCSH